MWPLTASCDNPPVGHFNRGGMGRSRRRRKGIALGLLADLCGEWRKPWEPYSLWITIERPNQKLHVAAFHTYIVLHLALFLDTQIGQTLHSLRLTDSQGVRSA